MRNEPKSHNRTPDSPKPVRYLDQAIAWLTAAFGFAGAKITEAPHETCYGEFQYGAEDLDGHRWLFSRHARDLSPDEWGAAIAHRPA